MNFIIRFFVSECKSKSPRQIDVAKEGCVKHVLL